MILQRNDHNTQRKIWGQCLLKNLNLGVSSLLQSHGRYFGKSGGLRQWKRGIFTNFMFNFMSENFQLR